VPEKITIVLPVDAQAPPERPLAAGVASLRGASIGFVDNGLWRSMSTVVDALTEHAGAEGASMAGVTPFDHLSADFAGQRSALLPFAQTVDVVVVVREVDVAHSARRQVAEQQESTETSR
jgi:hypothetical protein